MLGFGCQTNLQLHAYPTTLMGFFFSCMTWRELRIHQHRALKTTQRELWLPSIETCN